MSRNGRSKSQIGTGARRHGGVATTMAGHAAFDDYVHGRLDEAERRCRELLTGAPVDRPIALKVMALISMKRGDLRRAVDEWFPLAQAANPEDPDVWKFAARAAERLGDQALAVKAYRRALEFNPSDTAVLNNLANQLSAMGNLQGSVAALQLATRLEPDDPVFHHGLGNVYFKLAELEKSIAHYEKALLLKPDFGEALSSLVHSCYHACRWRGLEELCVRLNELIRSHAETDGAPVEMPLANVTRSDDVSLNHLVAKLESNSVKRLVANLGVTFRHDNSRPETDRRITIGYLSNAFRDHPTTHLMAGVLSRHDRARFKVCAYSTGVNDGSNARKRIMGAFDKFVDIRSLDTASAARAIFSDNVDILIELDGHIQGERLEIVALRPAPITASYLGFPGTTGADFIDYLITDKIVSPPSNAPYYTENLAYLPHTYQCNDFQQQISPRRFERSELGLPSDAIVLSSFNQAYKIEPVMFDAWMRLLKALPNAVLWLWRNVESAEGNLRREAFARGISSDRLVFAEKMPRPEHLARLSLADLALDTRIYNGHTTTSDALFAGVPVVTLQGRHFASRVSASLLTAIDAPELITLNLDDYEALVIKLARDHDCRNALREKLRRNRATMPLFDTARCVRNLERAYEEMVEIWRRGEAARTFDVV